MRGKPEHVEQRLTLTQRYELRELLFAAAVALVAIPFGLLLVQVTSSGFLTRIDASAAEYLHEWVRDSPATVTGLEVISFLGKPIWFYLVLGPAVIYLWVKGRKRLALFLAITALLGGAIDTVVKEVVDRPRPVLEDPVAHAMGKSFPSGHSMSSVVGYGALLLVFMPAIPRARRKLLVGATAVLVLLIGFSRLALGVHFITDVLGGFVLGAAWLMASAAAFNIWREEQGRKPAEPMEGLEPEAAHDLRPAG
ncbi:MAG TPA: phosphatase PAP2 family protein [Actinomycetota bacterium]|nr:phosphatase PAP2 family protein [Actinomycetota bacterium]